jgi:6-phosphogluconolactonase
LGATVIRHESRVGQAEALAGRVAGLLGEAIAARGRAALAVPGGTTPVAFLTALGARDLDWDRVAVTLTDERWVAPSSPRSNAKLLAETLFRGPAAAALFVPLRGDGPEPGDGLSALNTALVQNLLPLDVAVLGMGSDGHTASLFPGADHLAAALAPDAPPALTIRAPGVAEPRITLSAAVLRPARRFLLIAGADKAATLERALAPGPAEDMPVRAILPGAEIHHAP